MAQWLGHAFGMRKTQSQISSLPGSEQRFDPRTPASQKGIPRLRNTQTLVSPVFPVKCMWYKILACSVKAPLERLLPTGAQEQPGWRDSAAPRSPLGQSGHRGAAPTKATDVSVPSAPSVLACERSAVRAARARCSSLPACRHTLSSTGHHSAGTARADRHKAVSRHVARIQQNCPAEALLGTPAEVVSPVLPSACTSERGRWRGHLGSRPGSDSPDFRVQGGDSTRHALSPCFFNSPPTSN